MPAASDPLEILRDRFLTAMRAALGDDLPQNADPLITPARNPEFGDFQSNAAMPLGKSLGRKPRDVAQSIVDHLDLADLAEPAEVAGPGFINIRLKPEALARFLDALDTPDLGLEPPAHDERQTVVVDLCGVNLAKQMHVGHLRSTVIGDTIARLFERLGHSVIRQNHFGDWGLPIAMVTAAVKDRAAAGELDLDRLTLDDLDGIYREAQAACDSDDRGLEAVRRYDLGPKAQAELETQVQEAREATARARQALVNLQSGKKDTVVVWRRIAEITLHECAAVCARLQTKVTEEHTAGESTYRDELAPLVHDLLERRVAEISQGAAVVRLDDVGIREPLLIRKSDGGFLYATTDIAAIRRRVQKLGADEVVYAVDARQSLHFRQVFAAAVKAGCATKADGSTARLEHAAFGTVLGEDNRPLKTRSGENIKLADLLDEAVNRAEQAVAEKNPELTREQRRAVAEAVGIGAIKYADLSTDRVKDYVFSFDRMLAFEGDTGPYLQYALVRVRSILRKAEAQFEIDSQSLTGAGAPDFVIQTGEEKTLALELLSQPGAVRAAADALEPHRLCTSLHSLAVAFSSFFQNCPVLRAPDEPTRLARLRLTALTGRTLARGLETLGITPLEHM